MQALRKQMRAAGATVQVAKNRLVKIALQGTEAASISELMRGPTLIANSVDPVAAPKAAVAFAKNHDNLVILGGAMGATALNVDAIRSLATLPSLDELRAKLVGLIQHRRRGRAAHRAGAARARFRSLCREKMPPDATYKRFGLN